jgi:hypothetical protein
MGKFPILATWTSKIAAPGAQGKPEASGVIVIQGFLLNRRDGQGADATENKRKEFSRVVQAGPTIPFRPIGNQTPAWTDPTFHPILREPLVEDRFFHGMGFSSNHYRKKSRAGGIVLNPSEFKGFYP